MMKRTIKYLLAKLGYEIRRGPSLNSADGQLYTLRKYLRSDGSFDYEKYRQIQVEGNKRKIEYVWVLEENIVFLSGYIRKVTGTPRFGICHGTRRGREVEWFAKYLGCNVLGTEISDTAEEFPNTIQWDFHDTKAEWIGTADFIYSNSFDHSYDPEKCLNAWMSCLRQGGLCILEHSSAHGPSGTSELDPFGADIVLMPYLISTWGKGQYVVREIVEAPKKHEGLEYSYFILIQKL